MKEMRDKLYGLLRNKVGDDVTIDANIPASGEYHPRTDSLVFPKHPTKVSVDVIVHEAIHVAVDAYHTFAHINGRHDEGAAYAGQAMYNTVKTLQSVEDFMGSGNSDLIEL